MIAEGSISESCKSASEDRLPACLGQRASGLLISFATFGDAPIAEQAT